jgi:hypothetical protein
MDTVMLASFFDELEKIAGNAALSGTGIGKPASLPDGFTATGQMKSPVKSTNYTVMHNAPRTAAPDTTAPSKAEPPPPVRT